MKETNDWDATNYNKHADFVSILATPVVELLNPKKDEKILDLGCGDGTLSVDMEKVGAKIVAVDLSEDMVKNTKEKGIEAYVMSATELTFQNEFDAVFSNAVLHWVKEPEIAIEKIYNALKDDGRFIAEFGGYGNIKHLTDAMQTVFDIHPEYGEFDNPWYFPTADEYKQLLEDDGFEVTYIEIIPRPTKIDDISNWLNIFANGIVSHLTKEQQNNFNNEVRELLKPIIYSKKDGWVADYVRLRLRAEKRYKRAQTPYDLEKIINFMEKYTNVPMDLADGSLLVIAQNLHIKDIVSIDSDYDIYRTIKKEALRNLLR